MGKPKSTRKAADKPKAEKKTASAKTPAKKATAKSAPAKKSASAAKSIKPDEFKIQCNDDFTMVTCDYPENREFY